MADLHPDLPCPLPHRLRTGAVNFFAAQRIHASSPRRFELLASVSVMPPFTDFSKGLIDLRYLFYFLSVIALCLFLTNTVLQSQAGLNSHPYRAAFP